MLLNKKNNYLKEFLYIVEKIKNTNILIHIIYPVNYGDGLENNTQKYTNRCNSFFFGRNKIMLD